MAEPSGIGFERWAAQAIAHRWPGARLDEFDALRGDLSTRRFWRATISPQTGGAPSTAIVVDLGPDDLPRYVRVLKLVTDEPTEPPWINVHRFLSSLGAGVPSLYDVAPEKRAMLVEDVGELPLLDAARQPGAHVADLYRLAVEELLRLHVDGTRRIDDECIARRIAYDGRLFEWELKEFIELGLELIAPGVKAASIQEEIKALAARLDRYPRVLSHRDYHGHNLYLQEGSRLRIIDFQDALMAPAAQDLAVLMTTRDTGDVITPVIEKRLLDFYLAGLARRGAIAMSIADFEMSYRLCVLQHALKMIGRFEMFERNGKTGYRKFIPHLLMQARRMLAAMRADFPRLASALDA
ncbi:MAG: phosphotransferase [Candidatus Binatus sp.]|uniref:phosphotransferase n=1 Tax=Candidatus Binatus sp. TaxID=2811406 RepID=UPI0027199967|nr:phosphotransferase [Candidatus Binatus sp.]MDO8431987.1 phosphotransferase [Candidatus Binatus sp.]